MKYTKNVKINKICKSCGAIYYSGRSSQIYCTQQCYRKYFSKKSGRGFYGENLSTGTVGAIAELEISTSLMKQGFEVYRAMSQSSSCDLLALKNKIAYPIEVRSAFRNNDGKLNYPKHNIRAPYLALFIHLTQEVIYIPDLSKV